MPVAQLTQSQLTMEEIIDKAQALGISPQVVLIRAIQEAEGHTPCFGSANGDCPHTDCCFRSDCLTSEEKDKLSGQGIAPKLSEKVPLALTVQKDWLEKGILILPPRLASRMKGTNTLHLLYDIDEVLPYHEENRMIEGLNDFYSAKGIVPGDKIFVQLKTLEPTRLRLCRHW